MLLLLRLTGFPAAMLGSLGDKLSLGELSAEFGVLLEGVVAFAFPPVEVPAFSLVSFCKTKARAT